MEILILKKIQYKLNNTLFKYNVYGRITIYVFKNIPFHEHTHI